MILAIDPGNLESGYVLVENDLSKVIEKGKIPNEEMLNEIFFLIKNRHITDIAIEMVASYGMAVGKTVFDTCVWIGRFYQVCIEETNITPALIYRKDEKMSICYSMKANDSTIRQALKDRFGEVGTKDNQGYFYGFKKDIWQAMAVAVTYHDMYMGNE